MSVKVFTVLFNFFFWSRWFMHLSMICPTWHTWGKHWRKEGDLPLEFSPWGWYLDSIVQIYWDCIIHSLALLNVLKFLENFTDTHISLLHTVPNEEICQGICKGYVGGWYTVACSIRTIMSISLLFPTKPKVLEVGLIPLMCALQQGNVSRADCWPLTLFIHCLH